MRSFKHVYIEIINSCQFHCSFCPKTKRKPQVMTQEEFKHILSEVQQLTDTIYLHVLGEPLLHPQLDALLAIAADFRLFVNITTNGYLLNAMAPILLKHHHIKKINISLHSMEDIGQNAYSLSQYLKEITSFADQATRQIPTTIMYRLWNTNGQYGAILNYLQDYYQPQFPLLPEASPQNGHRLAYRIFLHQQHAFEWPVQAQQKQAALHDGCCLALKTHIAILADGTVVPCCLDSEGQLALGNIHKTPLIDLLQTPKATAMREGFQAQKAVEALCRQCTYKQRFE